MLKKKKKKQMDELKLSLTGGANGYTIRLKELLVRGASNYTVEDIKLGSPFEAVIRMPTLVLDAQYTRCVRRNFFFLLLLTRTHTPDLHLPTPRSPPPLLRPILYPPTWVARVLSDVCTFISFQFSRLFYVPSRESLSNLLTLFEFSFNYLNKLCRMNVSSKNS